MPPPARRSRTGFRRALAASVVAHLVVAAVVVMTSRSESDATPTQPEIDTRVLDVLVRLPAADLPLVPPRVDEPPAAQPRPASEQKPPAPGPPLAAAIPNHLPAELLAILRRPAAGAQPPGADPCLTPAGATTTPPLHGALKPGQAVVYVLDCSGSMGEFGKFALAREALVATLRRQPEAVRFQVIVYGAAARAVLPGGCVPANPGNLAEAEARLAGLRPSGPSNHPDAVRAAAALRPDVILLLTDAADLSANKLKPATAVGGKPVPVCVARVTAEGVGPPLELR